MATVYEGEEIDNGEPKVPQWYILKCQVNRENRVKKELDRRIKASGLDKFVEEVYVPVERVKEFAKNGKQHEVERKLYPGYIMVKMILNEDTWYLMRETNGVGDFAGTGGKPMPALEADVQRFLAFKDVDSQAKPRVEIPYEVNEHVKIIDGAFKDTDGVVTAINPALGNVTVNVKMFGRDTSLTLEYWQVEKVGSAN